MARKTKCGGLLYNEEVFKVINDVLTSADAESVTGYFLAHNCGGQKFDTEVFCEQRIGNSYVIGMLDEDGEPIAITSGIKANCSLLFDADLFELDEHGALTIIVNTEGQSLDDDENPAIEDDEHAEEYNPDDF